MQLPRGITGFTATDATDISRATPADFRAVCYSVARLVRGEVLSFEAAGATPNFHTTRIRYNNETIDIHCNAYYPLLAFSHPGNRRDCHLCFFASPYLSEAFTANGGFQVVSADDLACRVTDESLASLSPAELKQIRYWKPATIGQVIFNWWD